MPRNADRILDVLRELRIGCDGGTGVQFACKERGKGGLGGESACPLYGFGEDIEIER
jgi:hypothetical protein